MAEKQQNKSLFFWALYDWGNSAFSAIIQTFVFAAYFTKHVAIDETIGSSQWGLVNGISALIVALAAPILGAIADHGKHRKLWIISFTYLCIITTALLWYVVPNPSSINLALYLVSLGIISSELAFVFYNAMLPSLAGPKRVGRWSGFGWSFGYAGGMACLVLALYAFIESDSPWMPLDRSTATDVRATFLLAAIWYFLFSLPMFLFTPDTSGKGKTVGIALRDGMRELIQTIKNIRCYGHIVRFLIARMFYVDGLTTLFAFGGIYAATKFGMNAQEILLFGIAMHVTAGIGAACFAMVDDYIGGKRLIIISLTGLIIPTTLLLFTNDPSLFWLLGLILGIFVGPVQAASRSFMARIAPKHLRNEMFGFFALSGKATAFLGPLLIGWIIYLTGSQTAGMSIIIAFYAIGILLMLTVPNVES
ncbi:MAG: hypothetical protein K940chlam7_01530 [Chlamydiae bacterium]|nr:hypothetical protein [Chlamydiota bacterium]